MPVRELWAIVLSDCTGRLALERIRPAKSWAKKRIDLVYQRSHDTEDLMAQAWDSVDDPSIVTDILLTPAACDFILKANARPTKL